MPCKDAHVRGVRSGTSLPRVYSDVPGSSGLNTRGEEKNQFNSSSHRGSVLDPDFHLGQRNVCVCLAKQRVASSSGRMEFEKAMYRVYRRSVLRCYEPRGPSTFMRCCELTLLAVRAAVCVVGSQWVRFF